MFALRLAALVAATLATGLIAGVFYAYAISVMPALNRTDDRVLIDVMQKINVVIINPWFMLGFLGTVGFTLLAAALHLGKEHRTTLIWLGVALALNVIAFAVTSGLNVPLNDQLAAAGDPAQIGDLAKVRADFESAWVRWNILRAILHTLAFLVLTGALFVAGIQHGRTQVAGTVGAQQISQSRPMPSVGPQSAGQPYRAPIMAQQYGFGQGQPGSQPMGAHSLA
ncbi:anthrone oxygenase family protein [Nocardia pseudovaccinii]|uniref:anthrone oxygenase family protein n=1 Tax=Nocardia pseudovaccinii TaxID=189540 RepID=UPI0007A54B3C|nr:anthrone oxygenase family protein [Nocardia pseudovaccinii]